MRLVLIFVIALSIHMIQAQDSQNQQSVSFLEQLRSPLTKIIGEKWTMKIIGERTQPSEESVVLPPIPKLSSDARSLEIYNKKEDKVKLKLEQEEKYYIAYIKEIFEVTRQQKPNEDEVAKMLNALSQGGSREGVYHSLVLDSVYGGMENYEKATKSNAADFAIYFYERYLGKKVAKENLKGMNIYTLKRLIADKAIDVIDAYEGKRDELERWYAVMSSDLASKFPQVYQSKLRKDTSSTHHKFWATQVPVQHIKSEVVIKIHMALNSLM